MGDPIAVL